MEKATETFPKFQLKAEERFLKWEEEWWEEEGWQKKREIEDR